MTSDASAPAGPRAADAYVHLLDELIDGRLRPGDDIPITATSRSLGVSPTPVREALARLAESGLVHKHGARGYRAAPLLTTEEETALLDARAAIEPPLAELACRAASTALVPLLEASIADHRARIDDAPDFAHDRQASESFHRLLASHAPNAFLVRAYESLGAHVHRFRVLGSIGVSDGKHALREHEAILAAVAAGDPTATHEAMLAHIAAMRGRLTR